MSKHPLKTGNRSDHGTPGLAGLGPRGEETSHVPVRPGNFTARTPKKTRHSGSSFTLSQHASPSEVRSGGSSELVA